MLQMDPSKLPPYQPSGPPGVNPPPGFNPPPGYYPPPQQHIYPAQESYPPPPQPSYMQPPVQEVNFHAPPKENTVIITTQPVCGVYGPSSALTTCTFCHQTVITQVKREATTRTHLVALVLCSIGCCLLPYCMDSCQSINHYCVHCGAFLGSYQQ